VVRTGSTPRLLGSAAVAINAKDDATWGTPTFTINGFNTEIKVVGKASTSINWQCEVWNDSGSTP
ncbi:MAG TPA: hypothetical protein VER11_03790, partial [Polyangiaceae bacterium]|nr:hypothetical protein [Polyangiaceae bacterium]